MTPAASPTGSASRSTSGTSPAASSATSSTTSSPSTPPGARRTRACGATSGSSSPALLDKAVALGFDAVATGHYARSSRVPTGGASCTGPSTPPRTSRTCSGCSTPTSWPARSSPSATRPSRRCARRPPRGASRWPKKPDSHDICFIPDGDTRAWLTRRLGERPGELVDAVSGEVVGVARRGARLHGGAAARARPRPVGARRRAALRRVGRRADQPGGHRHRRPARRRPRRGRPPALVRPGADGARCGWGPRCAPTARRCRPPRRSRRRRGCRAGVVLDERLRGSRPASRSCSTRAPGSSGRRPSAAPAAPERRAAPASGAPVESRTRARAATRRELHCVDCPRRE